MKTGEIAMALGVTNQTILDWMARDELSSFFSPQALGEGDNVHRYYNDNDVLVLNTIRWLRFVEKKKHWGDIVSYLESGERRKEFPSNAIGGFDSRVVAIPHAEQAARASETLARLEEANKLIVEYRDRIVELENRQVEDRNHYEEEMRRLNDVIAQLNREIGRLEGQVSRLNHS